MGRTLKAICNTCQMEGHVCTCPGGGRGKVVAFCKYCRLPATDCRCEEIEKRVSSAGDPRDWDFWEDNQ
jgi:hypothetical protein